MITEALVSLRPGAKWSMNGEDYDQLVWVDIEQTKPTKAEIMAEVERLKIVFKKNEYQRLRQLEYPLIADQLDMLWHMMDDETIPGKNSTWYNTIKEVKDNNPK